MTFTHQTELRGTVDAVLAAQSSLDLSRPFAVSNADDLYGRESFQLLGRHLAPAPTAAWLASSSSAHSSASCRSRVGRAWWSMAT